MYKQVSFPASDPIGESLAKHGMKRSKVRRSQRRLSARSTLLIRITSRRALLRHHGRQHRHHQSHHKRSPYRVQDGASHRQVDVGHDHAQGALRWANRRMRKSLPTSMQRARVLSLGPSAGP